MHARVENLAPRLLVHHSAFILSPASDARTDKLMEETGLSHAAATARFLEGTNPTGRFVDPAHVADQLVFLCGPAASDVTGTVLPVEGGRLAGV